MGGVTDAFISTCIQALTGDYAMYCSKGRHFVQVLYVSFHGGLREERLGWVVGII